MAKTPNLSDSDLPTAMPPGGAGLERAPRRTDAVRELDVLRRVHDAWMQLREPIVIYDETERLLDFNQAFANLHRDADGRLILRRGMPFAEVSQWRVQTGFYATPDDEDAAPPDQRAAKTERHDRQSLHRLSDGRLILVDRYRLSDGSKVGVWTDVTSVRRGEEERRALEAQLQHAQRLEALGTLAGGIAHELNNALVPVLALAKLTIRRLPENSRDRRSIETILHAGERARDLVREILMFSRKHEQVRQSFDLGEVARTALHMLRPSLPATIRINEDIRPVPPIVGDPGQLHQVIVNLVTNGAHAIGSRHGTIKVSVEMASDGAAPAIALTVADTGAGMDETTLAQIFEPFFTTKSVGEGTGLGLSIAHGVVASHGGRIEVRSAPGQGSTFMVLLPLAATTHADNQPVPLA
jgi:signal transduction histidine kinase